MHKHLYSHIGRDLSMAFQLSCSSNKASYFSHWWRFEYDTFNYHAHLTSHHTSHKLPNMLTIRVSEIHLPLCSHCIFSFTSDDATMLP